VPSVILHVHPVGRQAGPLRRIAKNATLRPETKTLAGNAKNLPFLPSCLFSSC
jgi:hypothetical protein